MGGMQMSELIMFLTNEGKKHHQSFLISLSIYIFGK